MIPKRRNLISLIFIVNCISKCSLIRIKLSCFYFAISYLFAKSTPTKIENCAVFGSLLLSRLLAF